VSSAAPSDREFDYTDRDFSRARALIRERAGIALADAKRDLVYSRLARRVRTLGLHGIGEYLDRLEREGGEEWQLFVNALTTNLTAFFREPHHFPILAAHLRALGRRARIWCAAASTGEEPWSLAMTAVETFGTWKPPVSVLASDIDTAVLEQGERGVYAADRVERMEAERRARFFLRGTGPNAGRVRVRSELRSLVTFRCINLLAAGAWPVESPVDAIFCRNVMIYFDKPTQLAVLERFAPLLATDGLLFAGHSESLHHAAHLFRLRGKTVYGLAGHAARSAA
jgi:chemotaxis protein methyltransferase CheR